jgi:TonB-dependent receptor
MNGQKIVATYTGRNVELNVVNAAQISSVEVSKTLTPDMDGDAIGGTVNLVTKSSFDYDGSHVSINVGGGFATNSGKPLGNIDATFSTFLGKNKKWGLLVGGNYYNNPISAFENEFGYGEKTMADGTIEKFAITDFQEFNWIDNRQHYGFSASLDFRPNNNHQFHLNGNGNIFNNVNDRNTLRYRLSSANYINPTTISDVRTEMSFQGYEKQAEIFHFEFGGKSTFGILTSQYTVAYSMGGDKKDAQYDPGYDFNQRLNLTLDLSENLWPRVNVLNLKEDVILNPSNWILGGANGRTLKSENNFFSTNLDFNLPYLLGDNMSGELKFGGKYRREEKERGNTRWRGAWVGNGIPTMAEVSDGKTNDFNGIHEYGPIVEFKQYEAFYTSNLADGNIRQAPVIEDTDGLGGQFNTVEKMTAFYIMSNVYFGNFTLLLGVRDELTVSNYLGNEIHYDSEGNYTGYDKLEDSKTFNHILPNIQLKYDFGKNTQLRAAVTKAIARPSYFDIVPYLWVDGSRVEKGNPDLKYTTSWNYDIMFGHYFQGIGVFNFGVFAKKLNNIIYRKDYVEEDSGSIYNGYTIRQKVNGDEVKLYGFEVNWLQQFTFLPGFLEGFGVYANYTNVYSLTDYDTTDDIEPEKNVMPGQAANIANFGLNYEKYKLSARLSVNYSEKYLLSLNSNPEYNRYIGSQVYLDFSSSYQISEKLGVYFKVNNMLNENYTQYFGNPDRPRSNMLTGSNYLVGITYNF